MEGREGTMEVESTRGSLWEVSKLARLSQDQAYEVGLAAYWTKSCHRKAPPWM